MIESTGQRKNRKQQLDEWLDDALADTFPASDPVASPPAEKLIAERRPGVRESSEPIGRRKDGVSPLR